MNQPAMPFNAKAATIASFIKALDAGDGTRLQKTNHPRPVVRRGRGNSTISSPLYSVTMIVALDRQRLAFKFQLSAWRRSAKVAPFFTGMGILQTMFIGFDYGTANCSVAVMRENTLSC